MSFQFVTGRAVGVASYASIALLLLSLSGCGGGGGGGGGSGSTTTPGGGSNPPPPPADTTAPDTSITSGPATFTDQVSATFEFTSSEAGSTFEVSVDGGAFATATSPHTLSAVANGAHTISVRAKDAAGNTDNSPAMHTWTVSPLPDTTIIARPAALTNSTTASFMFSSSSPGAGFAYSLDGGAFVASGATIQLAGFSEGTHQLSVRAVVGTILVDATPATATWTVDLTPPSATIVFPLPNSYSDASTIAVRGGANDANGIASVSVNGVNAQSATSFGMWTATVPITAGNNTITVSATDAAGNVASSADTASVTNNGPPFTNLRAMDVDAANNRILAADERLHALIAIDPTSGATSILSDSTHGTGPNFDQIEGVIVDGTRALVLAGDDLMSVSLTTGNRTTLSAGGNAATEFSVGGIAVDSTNGIAYVVNATSKTVISVDLATGARSVVSSNSVGTGPVWNRPVDVVFDSSTSPDRLIVSDAGVFGSVPSVLLAVSISNGDRVALSSSAPTGQGQALESPSRMRLDAAHNRVLITESSINRSGILAVNLANGDRTEIAGPNTGTGREVLLPMSIAVNAAGTRAYFAGNPGTEVVAIDLQTLNRTAVSKANIGSGTPAINARGLALKGSSLLYLDSYRATLNSLDLNTGARTLVSGGSTGWGLVMTTPQDLVLDAAANLTYVIDSGTYSLLSIDLNDGGRRHISGVGVGNGPFLQFPRGLAIDGTRALVTDGIQASVLSVDLATGDRAFFSGSGAGSGFAFSIPTSIAIDRSNPSTPRALVMNINAGATEGVWSVDLTNGNRTAFSTTSPLGSGPSFLLPSDMVYDASGLRLLALDIQHKNLMSVSLANGARQILSGGNTSNQVVIGKGPRFTFPWSLAYDSPSGIAYVADADTLAIFAIDLATGERVIVSK